VDWVYLAKIWVPQINDITTDTDSPPAYLNVNFHSKVQRKITSVIILKWAAIQHKYYPEVLPVYTSKSKEFCLFGRH